MDHRAQKARRAGWWWATAFALALAPGAGPAHAAPPAPKADTTTLKGYVLQVLPDSGGLRVQPEQGAPVEVQLEGLVWPLRCQVGGEAARAALQEWAHAREVTVRLHGPARQGRVHGTVTIGTVVLNRRLVEEGHAFSSRSRWDQGPYVKQERLAQALNRGLFQDGRALPPAEYLRQHGPCR
jgi:endonuclease YncB( thermonuclease family)